MERFVCGFCFCFCFGHLVDQNLIVLLTKPQDNNMSQVSLLLDFVFSSVQQGTLDFLYHETNGIEFRHFLSDNKIRQE